MSFIQAMRRGACWAVIALSFAGASPAALAQTAPSASAIATAKELMTVTSATTLFGALIPGVIEQAKNLYLQQNPGLARDLNEISAQLRNDLAPRFSEVTDEIARLYATDFTEQDLKDILAFYKTAAGQKLLQKQPDVVDNSMAFAQRWANNLSDEVVGKMRDELKKRGHNL